MLMNLGLLLVTLFVLVLFKLMRRQPKKKGTSYREIYQKILTSEEYKVKGQYED